MERTLGRDATGLRAKAVALAQRPVACKSPAPIRPRMRAGAVGARGSVARVELAALTLAVVSGDLGRRLSIPREIHMLIVIWRAKWTQICK